MEANRKDPVFYGIWMVAGCFVLLFLFSGAGFYSFSIFINPLETTFGWSRSAISLTISIYMLFHGLAGPGIGYLTEVYGPKRVMTISAVVSGAAFVLVSFTTTLWYFYASYALLAVGSTGIGFIPASSLLSRWFRRRRGTAIGAAMVGISVGGLIMAPVVNAANDLYGWRMAFVFIGVLVWLLALPITLFVIRADPGEMGLLPDGGRAEAVSEAGVMDPDALGAPAQAKAPAPIGQALFSGTFLWIAAAFYLGPLAQLGMLQHQVPMIVAHGFTAGTAATALGLTAGLGGLGKLSFGRIAEIIPFRNAAGLCFGLQALAVFSLLIARGPILVWIYVLLFGFAMGGGIVLMPLAISQFFGLASFGTLLGAISFIQAAGTACGAVFSGFVSDATGSYRIAMMIYILFYAASALAIRMAGKADPSTTDPTES